MKKLLLIALAMMMLTAAGCGTTPEGQTGASSEQDASLEQAEDASRPDTSDAKPKQGQEERAPNPPPGFDGVQRADADYWEVVESEWAFAAAQPDDPQQQDMYNLVVTEEIPSALERPRELLEQGEVSPVPDTVVSTITNPQTGRQIVCTTTYTGYKDYVEEIFDYVVTFEGLVLYEEKGSILYPVQSFQWVDEETISTGFFTPRNLYNVNDSTYRLLTLPLSEPVTRLPEAVETYRERLIHTDCTWVDAKTGAYIVTQIDGTALEDQDYARNYGAGRQTLYYVNWKTGQTFPFYENDYQPAGAGRPEYLNIRYEFADTGDFVFVVNNRYNLMGLGPEVGAIAYHVDVTAEQTTELFEVPSDLMLAGIQGTTTTWITSFYSDYDLHAWLYDHRAGQVVWACAGAYHGRYLDRYPVFVDLTGDAVCILNPESRVEYRLPLEDLRGRFGDFEIPYNVHGLRIEVGDESYEIDYAQVLGLPDQGAA